MWNKLGSKIDEQVSFGGNLLRVTKKFNHKPPAAENQLKRQFSPLNPNETRAADITYIYTREGFLYLSVILDLCSRKVIGGAMSER